MIRIYLEKARYKFLIIIIIIIITCNKVAKAVKQCSIHYLSVELWIRRYNEETKFSVTPSFVLTHSSDSI